MKNVDTSPLSVWTKLVYGSGDWGIASFNTLRLIFYAIFLTDVVGLDPRLASLATLIGIFWDAVNDPLVGMVSDRLQSRLGKRRPFLLLFAIPFGLGFMALWWAPPFESQLALLVAVTLVFMLSDTFQSLVSVPYFSMTPEITLDYDERTSLTSFRMFFNLAASLTTAVVAPMIVNSVVSGGGTRQQAYLLAGALFGGIATVPFFLIVAFVREKNVHERELTDEPPRMTAVLRTANENIPFRFATLLYMLNWMTFDLVALMLPFFLTYWVAQGDLLASVPLLGDTLALESAVLGVLFITAVITLPWWNWLARRIGKRYAYIISMSFWAVVQLTIFFVPAGQVGLILFLAFLAGIGASAAHVLPDAIFPDVVEWDELRTGQRHEGIYYGTKNFTRKMTGALATFVALQMLGWFGYQAPPEAVTQFTQPDSALTAIRVLTGPIGALLLLGAAVVAYYYPLTREKHARIRRLLARRAQRTQN